MEKITIRDLFFLAADSIFTASCAFGLLYTAFLLDIHIFQERVLPIIQQQYWRLAVALMVVVLLYYLFVRFWSYREKGAISKIRLWTFFVRNCLAMMLIQVFIVIATLVLFFDAEKYMTLVNIKGAAFSLGALFTYTVIKNSKKYYLNNRAPTDSDENIDR